MSDPERGFETNALHVGQETPESHANARAPPIYQTTSYVFEDAEDAAASQFALEKPGHIYSRLMNPTNNILQERIAALEGGVGAVATSSGMAALNLATFLLADAGDNIVTASSLYGGTYTYFTHTAPRNGVEARFVDTLDYEAYEEAIDDDTAYVHFETIGNPALVTPDIERLADIAHDHGVPLFVDNTFATPALCRPPRTRRRHRLELHDEVDPRPRDDGGRRPRRRRELPLGRTRREVPRNRPGEPRLPRRQLPRDVRPAKFTYAGIARGLRDMGNQQAPFDAWQTIQGLETLPVRMERHCENAMAVAEFLEDHDDVSWVSLPGPREPRDPRRRQRVSGRGTAA